MKERLSEVVLAGRPALYLQQQLDTPEKKAKFAEYLWTTFPELPDVACEHKSLEAIPEAEMATALPTPCHVAMLGFEPDCSLKPATLRGGPRVPYRPAVTPLR